jgi:class 3 adenylate cyclase/ATP/maltotriose-dependent transcriptional regulator MalT
MATSTATILFCDVTASTELRARIGEAAADKLFVDLERRLRAAVERRGGRVLKTAGDGVMAAFESASEAVQTGVDMQRAAERRDDGVRLRVGIASGDVSWEGNDCFGLPVITASRLEGRAEPGHILVSQIVRLLAGERCEATFEAVGPLELKGLPEPVEAYAVRWESSDADDEVAVVPLPSMLNTPAHFPFVSRQDEWTTLESAWAAVKDGGRRVVLIGGEAGGGKTRLAAEFARACHEDGGAVLFGGCDAELVVPYQPWVQALDHLLRALDPDDLDAEVVTDLGALAPLLPALERRAVPTPFTVDADSERYRLFAAVDALLAEASRRWPVVLVLDDLHWGSAQTWALLGHVARAAHHARVLVVGTFRDVGEDVSDPLASSLADLRRVDTVSRVRLQGFDAIDVAALIARTTGHDLDVPLQRLVNEVTARTLGNAFFVGEMWHHFVATGVVSLQGGRWVVAGPLTTSAVPDSVREVVAERLARLPFAVRRLAELVAVAGQRVELRVVRMASDVTQAEVTNGLDALTTAGLLEAVERPMLAYQFTHALVRDTVEAGIPAAARAQLHLRVAEALESIHEGDPRNALAELARHYSEAAGLGVTPKAVYYCRRAAEQASASVAYEESLQLIDRALELTPDATIARAELLVARGEALMHLSDFDASARSCEEAFHMAREHGAARVAGEAAIGFGDSLHIPGLPGAPAVTMISEAIRLVGDDGSALRAQLEAVLAVALTHTGNVEAAHRARDNALRLARVHDDRTLSRAIQAAMITEDDPARLLEWARQADEYAERSGDMWSVAYATTSYMRALISLGRLDELGPILERHAEVCQRIFLVTGFFEEWSYRLIVALAKGDFAAAEAAADRCMEIGVNHVSGPGLYGLQMFAIRREQGRLAEAAPVLELAAGREETGMWLPGLAAMYTELGMLDKARNVVARLAPRDFAAVPRDSLWTATGAFLADACIALEDQENAAPLYRDLSKFAGQNLMVGMTVCFGPADRVLGGLASVLGRHDDAEAHFREAEAVAGRSRSPVWLARVHYERARHLARVGDVAGAGEMADRGLELAEERGMARLAEQCREIPRQPALTIVPSYPAGLSEREVEVLRCIAKGCSNREIGERLNISANTAANHVRAILQKTGCANRTEAAAYAARLALLD